MSGFRVIPVLILLGAISGAEETVSQPNVAIPVPRQPLPVPSDGSPWLGLQIARPDDATRAQLPSLPPGFGFIVRAVDPGGAAERCGLQPFDVLWKLEDQWLVNEGQFATLLRVHKPGDSITLSLFRSGKPMEVKATLGAQPANPALSVEPAMEAAVAPAEGCLLTRVINREARTAILRMEEGSASLKRLDDQTGYVLEIRNPSEEVVFSSNLPANGDTNGVPEPWRRRVGALKRGLDSALDGPVTPARTPRQRIIPPPPNP